ncbi:MAG: acetylornithine deacetylase/succinyl-diaminopimelate desuccinylase family protein [Geminicoccaceae bacterium]
MLQALFERIEAQRDALVDLTRELVRFPTINPPGDGYRACARHLGNRLTRTGFDVTYVRAEGAIGDSDRYPRINVIGRCEGFGPGPCVHFNGHIDVVEAGHGWTVDPFAGVVRDGRLYGRGSCDMKGGLAAAVIALESILAAGIRFAGALEISGTVDEESGGFAGVAHLAKEGRFSKPRVDHVIIPEPHSVGGICLGHRGVWWAEIETLGRVAHGSMPFLGECAIRHMGAFLNRIERQLLPKLATRQTAMPIEPPGARQSTLNINAIHGGQAEGHDGLPSPVVADSCRMMIDRRFLIEEDLEEVKAELVAILDQLGRDRPGFNYRIRDVMEVLPTQTAKDAPVVRAVAAAIEKVTGRRPQYVCSPGTYDQKHVFRIGGLEDCIAYGPGMVELAHQPDEYVAIDDLVTSAKVMAAAALTLLHVPA